MICTLFSYCPLCPKTSESHTDQLKAINPGPQIAGTYINHCSGKGLYPQGSRTGVELYFADLVCRRVRFPRQCSLLLCLRRSTEPGADNRGSPSPASSVVGSTLYLWNTAHIIIRPRDMLVALLSDKAETGSNWCAYCLLQSQFSLFFGLFV